MCLARCANGGKILGGKKLKLKCKCPRQSNGQKVCGWVGRKAFWDAATISGLTCDGGSSSSSTTTGSSTGTSGASGTATHCPNSTTVITAIGITCADGSTPVNGSGNTSGAGSTVTTAQSAVTTAAQTAGTTSTAAPTTAATTTAAASGSGWVPGSTEFETRTDTVSVGMSNCDPSGSGRIIGGTQAEEGSWPWMVRIRQRSQSIHWWPQMFCGGAIIGEHWVLTAGVCCFERYDEENNPDILTTDVRTTLTVLFNEHSIEYPMYDPNLEPLELSPTSIFPHPDFVSCPPDLPDVMLNQHGVPCTRNNDVCLLKFDENLLQNDLTDGWFDGENKSGFKLKQSLLHTRFIKDIN